MCKACEVVRSVIKPCDVVRVTRAFDTHRHGQKGIVVKCHGIHAEVVFPSGDYQQYELADLIRVAPAIGC